jgi:putative FmdB family regulatory protein
MPTYEYICEKCGHEFEAFRSISASPLKTCPEGLCARKKWGRGRVKKKIGAGAGLIFKGSGFYITDYRSKNYTEGAKKESTPAKTDTKAETRTTSAKTPAKPAAAPAK